MEEIRLPQETEGLAAVQVEVTAEAKETLGLFLR